MRVWIYHETNRPKIISTNDPVPEGWSITPICKTTDFDIDPDDVIGVQNLGQTIEGIKDCLNGALNLKEMKVGQLKEFAQKHFGASIRGRKPVLILQIRGLIHDSQ